MGKRGKGKGRGKGKVVPLQRIFNLCDSEFPSLGSIADVEERLVSTRGENSSQFIPTFGGSAAESSSSNSGENSSQCIPVYENSTVESKASYSGENSSKCVPAIDSSKSKRKKNRRNNAVHENKSQDNFLNVEEQAIISEITDINSLPNGERESNANKINISQASEISFTEQRVSSNLPALPDNLPSRPGVGTAGRIINLISNFFALQCKRSSIYHYDVEINYVHNKSHYKPKNLTAAEAAVAGISSVKHQQSRNVGKLKCKAVFEKLVNSQTLKKYNPIYDGAKNIFTTSPLPIDCKKSIPVNIEVEGKTRKYEVIIQPVKKANGTNEIDMKALGKMCSGEIDASSEVLMALNSIMNHREPTTSQVQVGRSFFFLNHSENKLSLGEGIEIWFGYNQSVHFTQKGPALVLNVAAKAFHKSGPVIDYVNEVLRRDITRSGALRPYEISKIEDCLRDLSVNVTHLKYRRKYKVQGVCKQSAQELILNVNGQNMSVAQYFASTYGKLQFPFLQCLHMKSANNKTFIPIEKCIITEGQPNLETLNKSINSKMIRQTAISPIERFNEIRNDAHYVQQQSGEQMKKFNLFMDLQPLGVKGRVIDPPAVGYCNSGRSCPDDRGVWRMDGKKLFKTSLEIKSWILLSFVDEGSCSLLKLQEFADLITRTSNKVGLHFGKLLDIKIFGRGISTKSALESAEKTKASFAVIVLSKKQSKQNRKSDYHNYDEIKFIADFKLGFVTQCMEESVILKFNEQIAINVCLKINAKLGGVNHILLNRCEIFSKPVIVFGADAVHSPRGSGCPSIAAVVGSLDAYPSKYKLACRVQDNPDDSKVSQELILEMEQMVESILRAFVEHTGGKFPEKIIFFRDGVSEGQFLTVRDKEVTDIQKASLTVIGHIVPITFITVQKRHQTRFRPSNPKEGIGKCGNIPPGTTVDSDVVHPSFFDYYLCSHEGIQGTSKPAHYTVLHDDNGFNADELQKLSYHLCHMYAKCNRSISIPAPVMYADLAAYRAKKYADLHIQKERETTSCHLGSKYGTCLLPSNARKAINDMGSFKNNMFFV